MDTIAAAPVWRANSSEETIRFIFCVVRRRKNRDLPFWAKSAKSAAASVTIHDWTAAAFLAMLQFLYTGTVAALPTETAVEAMGLADASPEEVFAEVRGRKDKF